MRKNYLRTGGSLMALAFVFAGITSTVTMAAPSDYQQYDLVWSDEFDGTSLNTNNWKYELGRGDNGWGNSELQLYTSSANNVFITDISSDNASGSQDKKALAIKAFKNGNSYTSGRLITKDLQNVKYGRIEAKLKVENGNTNAVWPAFWMLGQDIDNNGWPKCGELDIMEHANTKNYVGGTFHFPNANNQDVYKSGNGFYSNTSAGGSIETWHMYAVEWTPTEMRWYIDEYCYYTYKYTNQISKTTSAKDYFILLNLAIGSTNTAYTGRVPLPSDFTSATMYVDYVRVYQNDADLANGATYKGTWQKSSVINEHYITFYNGNDIVLQGTINDGQTINSNAFNGLEKNGYALTWITSDGTVLDLSKPIENSLPMKVKLYAKWTPVQTAPDNTVDKVSTPTFKLKRSSKKIVKVTLKAKGKANGFQIAYGTNKKVTKNVKKVLTKKKSYKFKLKSKKVYYFKVRAYKVTSSKKKLYSSWTRVKKIKTK